MRQTKGLMKKIFLIIILFFIFFVLLSAIILPHIEFKSLREKAQRELSSKLGGKLTIKKAFIYPLPFPHFLFKRVKFDIPEKAVGDIAILKVYPQIFPLFKKKFVLKKLILKESEVNLFYQSKKLKINKLNGKIFLKGQNKIAILLHFSSPFAKHVEIDGEVDRWKKIFLKLKGNNLEIMGVKGGEWKGNLKRIGEKWEINIDSLSLFYPSMEFSLWLKKDKEVRFLFKGFNININEVRQWAFKFAKDKKDIQNVFQILRAGNAPYLIVKSYGKDFKEAFSIHHLQFKGNLKKGNLFIPAVSLFLKDVSGEVEIKNAILNGWNVEAILGETIAKNGKIIIGLTKENTIFHLDTEILAKAKDLAVYLPKFIKDKKTLEIIKSFYDFEGIVKGHLILKDDLHKIKPSIEIQDIQLSFKHKKLPWPVKLEKGKIQIQLPLISWYEIKGSFGENYISKTNGKLLLSEKPYLKITEMIGKLHLSEIKKVKNFFNIDIKGELKTNSFYLEAFFNPFEIKKILFKGRAHNLILHSFFPEPLIIKDGEINFSENILDFKDCHVYLKDSSGILTGKIKINKKIEKIFLSGNAHLTSFFTTWFYNLIKIHPYFRLKPPYKIIGFETEIEKDKKYFKGKIIFPSKEIEIDFISTKDIIALNKFSMKGDERADCSFIYKDKALKFSFSGDIKKETIDELIEKKDFLKRIKGEIKGILNFKHPDFTTTGWIEVEKFFFPIKGKTFKISKLNLKGKEKTLAVFADVVSWDKYSWQNIIGEMKVVKGKPILTITQGQLCGIDTTGNISFEKGKFSIFSHLKAQNADLHQAILCLAKKDIIEGCFSLEAHLKMKEPFKKNLNGELYFLSKSGKIYKWPFFIKIFSFLDFMEIFKGKFSDLWKKGFSYHRFECKGKFEDGRFWLEKGFLEGPGLKAFAKGWIDPFKEKVDIVVFISPLRTADAIISNIPILGEILTGKSKTLISIPIGVKGSFKEPKIKILPISTVKEKIFVLEETMKSP